MKSKANVSFRSARPVAGQPDAAIAYRAGGLDGNKSGVPGLLAAGGIVAAIGAASCCVVPFALFMLGVSGAWIGNLTALGPYKPIFAAVAAGCLGYGFYLVDWKPRPACAEGTYCATPTAGRATKVGLWVAGILFVIALGFPEIASLFL